MELSKTNKYTDLIALIDPDKWGYDDLAPLFNVINRSITSYILIGSSQPLEKSLDDFILKIREYTKIPLIIFPSNSSNVSSYADGILFISLLNSRDPKFLIENHVKAAPFIHKYGLDVYSTGYIIIGSFETTVVRESNIIPFPNQFSDAIFQHVLAADFLGMQNIYLEGGSGTNTPVSTEIIRKVRSITDKKIVCGGGIRLPETAVAIAKAGTDFIVIGNLLEAENGLENFAKISERLEIFNQN
ncbi:MAG: phosphoglycerol geranylgeranyltransferase [Candidatus Delongbacteria bacterium]|nr:phosphoglycerol geranylgeranyltransferase [Candidatus Delongbacteria bacterium]MBN2835282.1 phosphoglycerol geranylgeranyltransferase [Candidatus Delongbacteria bacterium]